MCASRLRFWPKDSARLQREFETAAKRAAQIEEAARAQIQSLHSQPGDLCHRAGVLEGRLDALRASHDTKDPEQASPGSRQSDAGVTGRRTGRAAKSSTGARKQAAGS